MKANRLIFRKCRSHTTECSTSYHSSSGSIVLWSRFSISLSTLINIDKSSARMGIETLRTAIYMAVHSTGSSGVQPARRGARLRSCATATAAPFSPGPAGCPEALCIPALPAHPRTQRWHCGSTRATRRGCARSADAPRLPGRRKGVWRCA